MKKLIFALGLLFLCSNAWARTATWDGGDAGALASTAANWDTDTAPIAGDIVVFDATNGDNCTWDITAAIASINTTGYGGVVTASSTLNTTAGFTFANGTWAHGNQTIVVSSTATLAPGNNVLYGLTLSGYVAYAFSSDITTNGTFTYSNYASITGGYTLRAKGDIVGSNSGSICDITATTALSISIEGSTNQNINFSTDAGYPLRAPVNIASTGGTVYFTNNNHRLSKGLTRSSGTVDFITNTSTVIFSPQSAAVNVMAGTYYNLTMATYNSSTSYATNLDGNITVNNAYAHGLSTTSVTGYVKLIGYRIYTKGAVTLNDYQAPGNTTVLDINGSGAQAVDLRGGVSYYNNIPIEVTNTSSVTFSNNPSYTDSTITINGSGTYNLGTSTWNHKVGQITFTAGTINPSTSTLNITGATTLNTNGMSWYDITQGANITLGSDLDFSHNFTRTAGAVSGAYYLSPTGSTTHVIDGTNTISGFDCATGETCSFDDADIFTITNGKGNGTWQSDDATNTVDIDFTAETISTGAGTRVDSAGGVAVTTTGTITSCVNWSAPSTRKLIMVVA